MRQHRLSRHQTLHNVYELDVRVYGFEFTNETKHFGPSWLNWIPRYPIPTYIASHKHNMSEMAKAIGSWDFIITYFCCGCCCCCCYRSFLLFSFTKFIARFSVHQIKFFLTDSFFIRDLYIHNQLVIECEQKHTDALTHTNTLWNNETFFAWLFSQAFDEIICYFATLFAYIKRSMIPCHAVYLSVSVCLGIIHLYVLSPFIGADTHADTHTPV